VNVHNDLVNPWLVEHRTRRQQLRGLHVAPILLGKSIRFNGMLSVGWTRIVTGPLAFAFVATQRAITLGRDHGG
jgi:hypothetical protein